MISRTAAILAAASLLTMGTAAPAQSAHPLSLSHSPSIARAHADADGASDLRRRGAAIYVVGAIVLGLIIWGAFKLLDNDTHTVPASP